MLLNMKNEAAVWARLKKHKPADVWARRVEDASGNLGTADVFLARAGRAAWIELKHEGPNAKPSLRPGQAAFMVEARKAGLGCGYLIGHRDGSGRLIAGDMMDEKQWREHLVARFDSLDEDAIGFVLNYVGL